MWRYLGDRQLFRGPRPWNCGGLYTPDPPRKAGRSRHWKPPTPCFPLTHFCLSHVLQDRHSSTHTSRHNQLPYPNLSYTSDAHTRRAQGRPRRDMETRPPRGTQTSTYMQAWAQFHLLHEASAQPLWLGKVGRWGMSVGSLVWKPDCTETISCLSPWLILLVGGQHGLDMQGGGRAVQLGSVS